MNLLTVSLLVASAVCVTALDYEFIDLKSSQEISCDDYSRNVTLEYRRAMSNVVISSYKALSELSENNGVYSPFSIYLVLGAIGAGADPKITQSIYQYLNLPYDVCAREIYYRLASTRIIPGNDVSISNTRLFAFDETLAVNEIWRQFVIKYSLLNPISLPIKNNPNLAADEIRRLTSASLPNINLSGNSILLDAMDFNGLWSTGFSEVERAPFYNLNGKQIGHVDLMRKRQIVRVGFVESIQSKVLALPIGADGRYQAIYALTVGTSTVESAVDALTGGVIFETMASLRETQIPFEVAIPQYSMTSEIDFRVVFDKLGIPNIWTDESATGGISEPAALPSSYLQRVTLTLNATGVNPPLDYPAPPADAPTGVDPRIGRDFIVNQPFLLGILDSEIFTCVVATTYSVPTYPL